MIKAQVWIESFNSLMEYVEKNNTNYDLPWFTQSDHIGFTLSQIGHIVLTLSQISHIDLVK